MPNNNDERHIRFDDEEKRKALATYLCKSLKLVKELGIMNDEWDCEVLIESPSYQTVSEGYPAPQNLSAPTVLYPEENILTSTSRHISPETSGHTSGIGRSMSPQQTGVNDEDVIDVTDDDDRPPSQFMISPQMVDQSDFSQSQTNQTAGSFRDELEQNRSHTRSGPSSSSPNYPQRQARAKMYRDIVQAFDELVQNMNEQSRVLNESRFDSSNRTFTKSPGQSMGSNLGQSSYQADMEDSSDDDYADSSSGFLPPNMSTPPPHTSVQQRTVIQSNTRQRPVQDQRARLTVPTPGYQSSEPSQRIPRIIINPVRSSKRRCQTSPRRVCERQEASENTTSALIYIRQEPGPSQKPIARQLVFDKNFKGG